MCACACVCAFYEKGSGGGNETKAGRRECVVDLFVHVKSIKSHVFCFVGSSSWQTFLLSFYCIQFSML